MGGAGDVTETFGGAFIYFFLEEVESFVVSITFWTGYFGRLCPTG